MNLHVIILSAVAILLWLAVLLSLRWVSQKFRGKKLGKVTGTLFKLILSISPQFISRIFGGDATPVAPQPSQK